MDKDLVAIDIERQVVESDGAAYLRIDSKFRDFFKLCDEKHGVIGFRYDGESLNFGFILGKKNHEI